MAGKFASAVDEVVWALSLDGCEAECGSVEFGDGWFGLVEFSADEAAAIEVEAGLDARPLGAIVNEDSQGFVSVDFHTTIEGLWGTFEGHQMADLFT